MNELKRDDLPTISRHMKTLSENNVVTSQKRGVEKFYTLDLRYIGPIIEELYQKLKNITQ